VEVLSLTTRSSSVETWCGRLRRLKDAQPKMLPGMLSRAPGVQCGSGPSNGSRLPGLRKARTTASAIRLKG
jgi:hypothetical protein